MQLAMEQRAITKNVMRSVVSRSERAAGVLDAIMSNDKLSVHARVAAARTLLEFAYKTFEIQDIVERIEALERSVKND